MEKFVPNLKKKYLEEVAPELYKDFKYTSKMQIPALEKIVVSAGVGDAIADKKYLDATVKELEQITGQHGIAGSNGSRTIHRSLRAFCA